MVAEEREFNIGVEMSGQSNDQRSLVKVPTNIN